MNYCVMDGEGNLLCVVWADSAEDAVKKAAGGGYPAACKAEPKPERPEHNRP